MTAYYYDNTAGSDLSSGLSRSRPKRALPSAMQPGDTHLLKDGQTHTAGKDVYFSSGSILGTWDGGIATLVPTGTPNSLSVVGKPGAGITGVGINNLRILGGAAGSRQLNVSGVTGLYGLTLTRVNFDGQDQCQWSLRAVQCPGSIRFVDCGATRVLQDLIYAETCGGMRFEGFVASDPNGAQNYTGDDIQIGAGAWGFFHVVPSATRRSALSNRRSGKHGIIFGGDGCTDYRVESADFVGGSRCMTLDSVVVGAVIRGNTFKAATAPISQYSTDRCLLLKGAVDALIEDNDFDPAGIAQGIENWNPSGSHIYARNRIAPAFRFGARHYGTGPSRMIFRDNTIENPAAMVGDPLAASVLCGTGHEYAGLNNSWTAQQPNMLRVGSAVYASLADAKAAGYERSSVIRA